MAQSRCSLKQVLLLAHRLQLAIIPQPLPLQQQLLLQHHPALPPSHLREVPGTQLRRAPDDPQLLAKGGGVGALELDLHQVKAEVGLGV